MSAHADELDALRSAAADAAFAAALHSAPAINELAANIEVSLATVDALVAEVVAIGHAAEHLLDRGDTGDVGTLTDELDNSLLGSVLHGDDALVSSREYGCWGAEPHDSGRALLSSSLLSISQIGASPPPPQTPPAASRSPHAAMTAPASPYARAAIHRAVERLHGSPGLLVGCESPQTADARQTVAAEEMLSDHYAWHVGSLDAAAAVVDAVIADEADAAANDTWRESAADSILHDELVALMREAAAEAVDDVALEEDYSVGSSYWGDDDADAGQTPVSDTATAASNPAPLSKPSRAARPTRPAPRPPLLLPAQ
ncbi:uncharacterized protein AMSG_01256 [Thecamonas trahens ATCC 50062]|uniref:Uncharacterized protein n=1 Tax=Thecamonas trahens ATCC 50062 TaxID=461836 RepID=A0A0L0DMN8_THETB|nr:hypothetical protein AMSG_01256 [Thecamonas trahens ATCC 50062]KNC53545.1 hypothetical protein AMSG_01256 [Thecamonas trahens ATCC 50062]|eukprot:XP_013761864.1 hypothetical protein AMSG_01256 [Thecamonas trahens ATCC 50062]